MSQFYPIICNKKERFCLSGNLDSLCGEFLKKYAGNKTAEELVENQRHEAELYYKYKEFYGYVFYIGKKI